MKNGTAHRLVHAGTTLYKVTVGRTAQTRRVYARWPTGKAAGVQLNEKLVRWTARRTLYDGKRYSPPALLRRCRKSPLQGAERKERATSYYRKPLTGKRTDSYRGTEETKAETCII
ncbi:MAG: hypothetical protein ACLRI7_14155 [Ruthenibacterium lactatiformans]